MNDLTQLKHQDDPLRRLFYEKLKRMPIDELLCLRDDLQRIRVQERRSKFRLIKGGRAADNASAKIIQTMRGETMQVFDGL